MAPDLEKCPRRLLVCEKSNFLNEASRHEAHVAKHSFNYKVSLLIPECGLLPAEIANVINNFSSYYLVRDLPVYRFLEEDMLKIMKKGSFYALSYKTRLDEDNVIAFLSKKLILSLDKDTYEQLGLEGKPSLYNHRKPMRYVVTVDLTDKSLVPGAKRYQQVLLSLKERVPLKSDFLLTDCHSASSPPLHNSKRVLSLRHTKPSPLRLFKLLLLLHNHPEQTWMKLLTALFRVHELTGTLIDRDGHLKVLLSQYTYEKCRPTLSAHKLRDLLCPSLQASDLHGKTHSCTPEHFLEWLGAVNLNISCENSATSFVSTYACPEPCSSVSQALLYTVTGLIPSEDISALLQELRRYFDAPKFTVWVSLTVHGFVDSPVCWGMTEHGFLKGGENFYNFVCFKNQDYWLHMATGAHDGCPP